MLLHYRLEEVLTTLREWKKENGILLGTGGDGTKGEGGGGGGDLWRNTQGPLPVIAMSGCFYGGQ